VQEIFPPVVSAGQTTSVKIQTGRFTQDIDAILFSHPGIQAVLEKSTPLPFDDQPQPLYGSFQISVAPDVPEGIYELWAAGRYGISNPRTIAVVHRPVVVLPGEPHPTPLPRLKQGVVYVGRTLPNARLDFQLDSSLDPCRIAVASQPLDSLALPALWVQDSDGRTLGRRRIQTEPTLVFNSQDARAHESSDSWIFGLYDFLYRGGSGYTFALEVDPAPSVAWFTRSETRLSSLAQTGLEEWSSSVGTRACETCPIQMPTPPWSTQVEWDAEADRMALEFPPLENAGYECEVFTLSPQGATDIRAVVERIATSDEPPTQELLSVVDDGPTLGSRGVRWISQDPHAVIPSGPASKTVRVTLIDLLHAPLKRSPPKALVRVGPSVPRFHAIMHWSPDTNQGPQAQITGACLLRGGQIGLHVLLRRAGGFTGPVAVSLEGLPSGITADPAVLSPGQTETELVLVADENAAAWIGPVQAVARATIGDREVTVNVAHATIAASASSDRGYPEGRLTSQMMLRVIEQETAPIQILAAQGAIIEVQQGAKAAIPVRAVRRSGGEAKCILRPQNVPPKVTFGEFELAAGAVEANPELQVAADAPVGEYTLWFLVEATVKRPLHPESHARWLAYRDRLQTRLADPSWSGDRAALEKAIADAQPRAEALAKETAPRDFPTFFSAANFRLRILPAPPK
jgi:hypothetical protein